MPTEATPYPGYPQTPCPRCGGSTAEPWRRWPACPLCNPLSPKGGAA